MNCTNCQVAMTDQDLFCGECGTRVNRADSLAASEPIPSAQVPAGPPPLNPAALEQPLKKSIPLPPPPRRAAEAASDVKIVAVVAPAIPIAQREAPPSAAPPVRPAAKSPAPQPAALPAQGPRNAAPPVRPAAPASPPAFAPQQFQATNYASYAAHPPTYPAAKKGGFWKSLICVLVLGQAAAIAFLVYRPDRYFFSNETETEKSDEGKSTQGASGQRSQAQKTLAELTSKLTGAAQPSQGADGGSKGNKDIENKTGAETHVEPGHTGPTGHEVGGKELDPKEVEPKTEFPPAKVEIHARGDDVKPGDVKPGEEKPGEVKTEITTRQETKPEEFPPLKIDEPKIDSFPPKIDPQPEQPQENADDLISLARAYLEKGESKGAYELLYRAIQLAPDHASAHLHLGKLLRDMGHSDEALSHLRQAVERDPNSAEAASELGAMYVNLGNPNDAIRILERAVELAPHWAPAYNNLGAALVARFGVFGPESTESAGDLERAIKCFQSAVMIDPNQPKYAENLKAAETELQNFVARFQPADPAWIEGPGMDELPPAEPTDVPPGEGYEEEYEEEYTEDPSHLPPPAPAPSN